MRDFSKQNGFTLIEILVSMMVMSLSLVVIMGLFSGGLQSKRRAQEHNTAVELAANQMERALSADTLEPGTARGEIDSGYRWKADISELIDEKMQPSSGIIIEPEFLLFSIEIEVNWGPSDQEKSYTLHAVHSQKKK